MSKPDAVEKKAIDLDDLNKSKKQDKGKKQGRLAKFGGLFALVIIIIIFVLLAMANINIGQWFADVTIWYYDTAGEWGIYFAVFLLTLIGNATVIFPVPFTVVIIVISAILGPSQPWYFPFVIGVFAGTGATFGETSAWLVGRGAREWARFKESEKVNRMKRWVEKGFAPLMIFIFAATPLADDPFLMVLGFMGYALWRALMWCFVGKWLMCFIVSGLTIWAADTTWGQDLIKLFGIDIQAARLRQVPAESNLVTSTITWIITFSIVIALIYVDWDKVGARFNAWNTKRTGPTTFYPPAIPDPEVTVRNDGATEIKPTKDANQETKAPQ